ncbi:E3 ubiquitin-protein ligase [Aphelenchoides fujianensis]|nr:E3 ubiquitin-protein ligase [Aphelenchoides fujianensis]
MTHSVRPPSVRLATCEDDFNNNNNNEDLAGIASSSSASSTSYSTGMSSSFMSQRSTNGNSSTESITNLPKGWEVRVDKYGHLIYVDHVHRRTTWNPPVILEREYAEEAENRYGHARRTVFVSNSPDGDLGTQLTNNNVNESQISSGSSKSTNAALTFLRRDDFVRVLHQNETALKMYTDSRYLKQIVHRLRKDIAQFEDFENNREMVNFLNAFADTTQPLPTGWEIAKERGTTLQKFFIDHNRKKITLIDPRLPIETRRGRSEPPPAHGTDMNRNLISDIRHRCEEIERLIRRALPRGGPRNLRENPEDDADFVRAISIIDEASTSARSAFEENVHYFYSSLRRAGYAQGPSRVRFTLRRSHLMNDAFEKILAVDAGILRKSKMIISFDEEEGCADEVLGLAIIHRCQIDSFFTTAFYKMLLGM